VELNLLTIKLGDKDAQISSVTQDAAKLKEDNMKLQTQYYQDKSDKEALHMQVDSLRENLAHASEANSTHQP
jgi:chromosome segregation ATPase